LKWRIHVTEGLTQLTRILERALLETGIEPLYRSGFVSSLITALVGVPALSQSELSYCTVLPVRLFTGDVVRLSRIEGPNAFKIITSLRLSGSG
jgi:hypothetical protein